MCFFTPEDFRNPEVNTVNKGRDIRKFDTAENCYLTS